MQICYTKVHGEIVHDESEYPVCALLNDKDVEIEELKEEITRLQKEVEKLDIRPFKDI